ncbi:SGNH/GDSL hydrolase family protein [Sediminibacillus massiliensis]|uniref:SGNH/GDSL hydrolase family protein n=1 Tax=Sediminibacillus massiliensis TaxID=1926277 RepID=UPI000988720B|nr:SGNH/GDSL hydrolase family protein [Sediminibacillus massiliensis]
MKRYLFIFSIIAAIIFITLVGFGNGERESNIKNDKGGDWVGAWTASMQAPFEKGNSQKGFGNQTVRMIVYPHVEGGNARIRLSNVFGATSLTIDEVHVAIPKKDGGIKSGSDQKVTFDGNQAVTIPSGERIYSDPIPIEINRSDGLAVSVYVQKETGPTTWHAHSMQDTYVSKGNSVDEGSRAFEKSEAAWYWLDGVDVIPDDSVKGAIAVLGSSIANGNKSTKNANHRWPDLLAERIHKESPESKLSVLNAGISGNQLLNSPPGRGLNALKRLERDVLSQSGVKAVILHQGLNDVRHHPDYGSEKIIARIKEIIDTAHDKGLKIYGGTLAPYKGSGLYTPEGERTRQEVNEWIRNSGSFDGVIDFDKALRDPDNPDKFLAEYDAGDHFHPNDAGYEKMAETVDISMFKEDGILK